MKNSYFRVTSIFIMLLFCMLPMASAGNGSGGNTGGGGFGHCDSCSVSSDTTKNTGRCVACPTGEGDACIVDGAGMGDPVCMPETY